MSAPAARVAFFTIGQSPRSDVVPEMAGMLGADVAIDEFGVLDGLSADELRSLAPREGGYRFASRMRDGSQVELDKRAVEERLAHLMLQADGRGYAALVPLCTGTAIPPMRSLVVEPQQVVDHALAGLAAHCRRVGLLVPLAQQAAAFHLAVPPGCDTQVAHASPYEPDRDRAVRAFEDAGRALAGCDLIVMHCMGYASWMRQIVSAASGTPVLQSNRIVAGMLAQLLA